MRQTCTQGVAERPKERGKTEEAGGGTDMGAAQESKRRPRDRYRATPIKTYASPNPRRRASHA